MRYRLTTTGNEGIYRRDDNGDLIARARWTDAATGKRSDTSKGVPRVEGETAKQYMARAVEALRTLRLDIDATARAGSDPHQTFAAYARSVIDQRVAAGIVKPSTAKRYNWELDKKLLPVWGDMYLDKITRIAVKDWMAEIGGRVIAKEAKPSAVNSYWRTFKSIMSDAAVDFRMANPCERIHAVSLSHHRTYTIKNTNSLLIGELPEFFKAAREVAPLFYAYLYLGIFTGRRECELKPLRAVDPDADINWKTGMLEVRRSQTKGCEPAETTKQKKDVAAMLPRAMLDVLEEHRERLGIPNKGEMSGRDPRWPSWRPGSPLLFPPLVKTRTGYLGEAPLATVLPRICEKAKIKKHLSGRMMRRTFNSLGDEAGIEKEVQKAMSGHKTDKMKEHYSDVALERSKKALVKMLAFTGIQ